MQEITITGGGLAGLALGRLLRGNGVPVTVLEAGAYPRHRVCGEFINGLSDVEMQALHLPALLAGQPRHTESVWFTGGRGAGRRILPDAATAISRWKLDAALAGDFTARGGRLECGRRAAPDAAGEGQVLACGRRRSAARWLGLKAHYHGLTLHAGLEMHFAQGGYAGLTAVEDGRVNVCALLPAGAAPRRAAAVDALPAALRAVGLRELAVRLENAQIDPASITGISHFALGWDRGEEGSCLALGDRAAIIPPFTGNGMSMALQGALTAAPILTAWSSGELTWPAAVAETRAALHRRFARRMALAPRVQSLLLHPVLRWLPPLLLRTRLLPFNVLFRCLRN